MRSGDSAGSWPMDRTARSLLATPFDPAVRVGPQPTSATISNAARYRACMAFLPERFLMTATIHSILRPRPRTALVCFLAIVAAASCAEGAAPFAETDVSLFANDECHYRLPSLLITK